MENRLIFEAREQLRYMKHMHKRMSKRLNELEKYKGWVLRKEGNRSEQHSYYDVVFPGAGKKAYLGNESNEDVLNVKRYRYAKEALAVLEGNIRRLEDLINNYISVDYQSVNSRLPATYQTSISETLSSYGATALNRSGSSESAAPIGSSAFLASLPQEAIIWKQKLEDEKAKYPEYKPEQKKHMALDGTWMRSKSEVMIANILLLTGIPFVYEARLFGDKYLLPDFAILSLIDLKTVIIIEHQGMVFEDEYSDKFIRSLRQYLDTEWIPNENIFFTFDNARETLDPRQLLAILRKHVCPSFELPDPEILQQAVLAA